MAPAGVSVPPCSGLVDVFAPVIPDLPFKPGVHVHYQETVLHVRDGLPKMKDLPAETGGSGQTSPESPSRAPKPVGKSPG